jgi:hypothetical protein
MLADSFIAHLSCDSEKFFQINLSHSHISCSVGEAHHFNTFAISVAKAVLSTLKSVIFGCPVCCDTQFCTAFTAGNQDCFISVIISFKSDRCQTAVEKAILLSFIFQEVQFLINAC